MKNISSSKIELCPEQREELLRLLRSAAPPAKLD